ncbi:MAG: hypothetical protein UMU75_01990 [Halomonas sp.]|nr:hypothetical protein [Halomonas sp.]
MRDSVTQAQHLIGATLHDPQRRRQGRIVGVDQTRDLPALLIVWDGQGQAERVALPVRELRDLVTACMAAATRKVAGASHDKESGTVATMVQQRVMHVGGR